jgi:hypothetical protein
MGTHAAQHHERHSAEHARNVAESEMSWNPPAPDAAAWNAPIVEDPALTIGEMKMRESRMHVDHVQDMVPFWIRGVEAAEKGEVLRLEQFLETLQAASDAWLNVASGDPWTQVDQEWGDDAWGIQGDKIQEWDTTNEKADGWDFTLGADAWGVDTKSISSVHGAIRMGALGEWQRQQGQGKKFARKKQSPKDAYNFVEEVARQQAVDDERKRQMHSFFNVRVVVFIGLLTEVPIADAHT